MFVMQIKTKPIPPNPNPVKNMLNRIIKTNLQQADEDVPIDAVKQINIKMDSIKYSTARQ